MSVAPKTTMTGIIFGKRLCSCERVREKNTIYWFGICSSLGKDHCYLT